MMENYQDYFYRSADDRLDLYARDYNSKADGTPILMMHGLTRNSADFEGIANILHYNHRLIVPDQRGRGRSAYDHDPSNYTPLVYARDMFALLLSLNIDRAILLGTSMGGLIAMLMVANQHDIAQAIILNDIGPVVDPKGLKRLQGYVGKPVRLESWQDAAEHCRSTNDTAFPDYDDDDWLAFANRTFIADKSGSPQLAYDMAISQGVQGAEPSAAPADLWPVWNMLSDIPTLVLRGQKSDILSPETLLRMEKEHSGYFQMKEISRRGHAPMLDEPEAMAAIEQFLTEILSDVTSVE